MSSISTKVYILTIYLNHTFDVLIDDSVAPRNVSTVNLYRLDDGVQDGWICLSKLLNWPLFVSEILQGQECCFSFSMNIPSSVIQGEGPLAENFILLAF